MFVSLASVLTIPGKAGIRFLVASSILRLIYSVGIHPTLWFLGGINVLITTIHLVSSMGNRGTFNKKVKQILNDGEFMYHVLYLVICTLGVCMHPFFYSILVSEFMKMLLQSHQKMFLFVSCLMLSIKKKR